MKIAARIIFVLMLTVGFVRFGYAERYERYICPPPEDYYYYYPQRYYRQHQSRYYYRPGYYRYSPRVGRFYYYTPYSETWSTTTVAPGSGIVVEEEMY